MSCTIVCQSAYKTRIQNNPIFKVLEIAKQKLFSKTQNVGMCVCLYFENGVHKTILAKIIGECWRVFGEFDKDINVLDKRGGKMSEEVQGRIEKMIKKSEAILNAGKEKLKPCPFCGGNAQYDEDCFGRGLVQCKKCGAVIIDKYTYQDCIELWDNREVANRTWTQKVYDSFGEDGEQE